METLLFVVRGPLTLQVGVVVVLNVQEAMFHVRQ